MKLRSFIYALALSALTLTPQLAAAAAIFTTIDDVANKICEVVNILFTGALILTIIFVLLAAIKYITKGSDPKSVGEAHQMLIWAAIGFAIALAASVFPSIIAGLLGADSLTYPSNC